MANLFLGIIKDKETDTVIWDHISQYSDDTLHVDGFSGEFSPLNGEYRKGNHLKSEVEEKYPSLEFISMDLGDVDVEDLMNNL
ncbi:MAG: hypothetical protein PF487_09015 [Bacteroidales bacterium]|jgi:hypothetical protein|nr:hypothetical protein [Bacteroidales bacterium]